MDFSGAVSCGYNLCHQDTQTAYDQLIWIAQQAKIKSIISIAKKLHHSNPQLVYERTREQQTNGLAPSSSQVC